MDILIKNGLVIDPKNSINIEKLDVLVKDGVIAKIEKNINISDENLHIISADNCWVIPGLIDLHVHLREPGYEHKETIETGSKSAAAGGFTTICAMPNTKPVIDNKEIVGLINTIAKDSAIVNVLPIGSITKNQDGHELAELSEMFEAGVCAFSEDGKTVENTLLMEECFEIAKKLEVPVFSHCEDIQLVKGGIMNEGKTSKKLGLKGISNISEDVIIARDIVISSKTKAKLHICHVSTKGGVEIIRSAKKKMYNITAEVCPHHFTLSDESIDGSDTNFKMNPPLRTKSDIDAILEGLKDDTLSIIATDHAPHTETEKSIGFEKAPNGIVGLETALPLGITMLVDKNILTPFELIKKMTINPANVLGIHKGSLGLNTIADITIVDPNFQYEIDISKFHSKSKNSPFGGIKVKGLIKYTIVSGRIVYDSKQVD